MSDRGELWRDAPTELAPHEDASERFIAELSHVGGTGVRVPPRDLIAEVQSTLLDAGAARVALTADLSDARPAIAGALAAA
jgi:hypothetical protein